jgi:cytochrome c553
LFEAGGLSPARRDSGRWPGAGCLTEEQQKNMRMKKLLTITLAVAAMAAWSARAADAKELYEKDCAKCHGADGKGETKMGKKYNCKDYTDAKVQAELKDDAAIKAIKEGLKDKDGKQVMKPAEGLSDDEIKGLVAYMRTFKK